LENIKEIKKYYEYKKKFFSNELGYLLKTKARTSPGFYNIEKSIF
jgi:hypothetical protein